MLGVGEKADVGAHLAGLALGVGVGIAVGPIGVRGVKLLGQGVLTAMTIAFVSVAWRLSRG
jgi:hypothetical protein